MIAQPRRRRGGLGAGAPAVDPDGGLRGVRGGRAADGGDVVEQRAVGVVADRGDHRHPEQRDRAAEGLVAEAEQVGQRAAAAGDDRDLDPAHGGEIPEGADDRGRRVAVLHGGEAPDEPSGPAATGSAARMSSRALPLSPVITPIVRGSSGSGRRRWRSSSPSASSALRRRSIRASRSPSPATRRSVTENEKLGEEVALPG